MRLIVLGALFGALMSTLLPGAEATSTTTAAAPGRVAVDYRCVMDVFGHTAAGRIKFRRVVNTGVTVAKTSRVAFSWRPVSWSMLGNEQWPGHEISFQMVPGTDGRVRVVRTEWMAGSANLRVRVVKVLGTGYPTRLITSADNRLYWVDADGWLRRASFTDRGSLHLYGETTLPVRITGATAMTAIGSDRGMRVYWTDRAGALHVGVDRGDASTTAVLRTSGFSGTTGLEAGHCHQPNYARMRPYAALFSANRTTGVARFRRLLRYGTLDGGASDGEVTAPQRVSPADWNWFRLG